MVSMRSGRLYENITQAIANVCGDWGDHDRLDRPCSILLASISLLHRKTAITEKIEGHEFCSFFEGCYCAGSRTTMIVFVGSSLVPGDRDDMRTPCSLPSSTIVSVVANGQYDRGAII